MTDAEPMGAAVIGLGVGQSHAEAYDQLAETALVAVCDSQAARLRPVAERYRCRAYGSVDDLLAEHVAAGEYIYQAGPGLTAGPEEGHYWPTDYRYRRPASPNYHARQIADLVAAIRAGRRPLVDAVEGRKSVAILLAIYESSRTGLPVRVDAPVVA